MKDKKWLIKEIDNLIYEDSILKQEPFGHVFGWINAEIVKKIINQLDEPEVNNQIDKLANFIMNEVEGEPSQSQGAVDTAIRIIKSYQNQETLSQVWIDEHKVARISNIRKMTTDDVVPARELQNLLVPTLSEMETVEITEEQVMDWLDNNDEWLDNNDFYDHITAETVLENAVINGSLSYYGTKYAVIEKPVIPHFVVDWIEKARRRDMDLFDVMAHYGMSDQVSNWIEKDNTDIIARAWLDGYEVEKEPHPILKAFDEKAEEFKGYGDSYRRILQVRKAIENVIEEENE